MDIKFNMAEMTKNYTGFNMKQDVYLMFRPIGIKDREEQLRTRILDINRGDTMVLDFSNVRLVDVSYIDEIVLITLLECREDRYGDRYLAVTGLNEGVKNNLEAAISWRFDRFDKFVPVVEKGSNKATKVIGNLEKSLSETYAFIEQNKYVSAKDIVSYFSIDQRNANTRLKRLFDYRLVKREVLIDEDGKRLAYMKL